MSRRREAREDVESGQSLLGGEGNDSSTIIDETVGKHNSGQHSFSLDVEDACARSSPIAQAGATYHDRGWAFAFKTNVIITILGAACYGSLALQAILTDQADSGLGNRRLEHSMHEFGLISALTLGLGLIALTVGIAMFVLHSFICCGKCLVWTSVVVTFVYWLGMIHNGHHAWAFSASVAFPIIALVVYRERARPPFCAVTLKVAAAAIKSMPGTIFTSLCVIVVQLLWFLVSLVAALGSFVYLETVEGSDGSMHRAIDCRLANSVGSQKTLGCYCMGEKVSEGICNYRGWGGGLMLLWMVSMVWGLFVMKNIVTCTVSGSVAAWWFTPKDAKPVKGALYRATRHSFGTLCKAALTVNIASWLLFIVEVMLHVVPGASCLFRFAATAVTYPLTYSVTFVGIYGLDLASAFRRVREVFVRFGVTSSANDLMAYLTSLVLFCMTLITFGGVLYLVQRDILQNHIIGFTVVAPLLFGSIAFLFVIGTVVEVIRSALKAVLVCFVQDPEVLKETRGHQLHDELTAAWVKIHPTKLRNDMTTPMEPLNTAHAQT